jgi:prepilin-type N-terminal cleavage/methylation domain-containing protein/prepilin-type processing-associated H-X9-DG protein
MKCLRKAFTLVEVLVVIAIISILISLMLPAVGAMREAARRATCQSRLAQVGMALQKYESGYRMLPPGTTEPKGPIHNVAEGIQLSWTVRVLPYLNEGALFKQIDLAAGAYAEKNAAVRRIHLQAFACPTQGFARQSSTPASDYAGCQNEVESPIAEDNHGVLFLNSRISARDVTDGVHHTIYVGEKQSAAGDLGWMSGTRATLRNTGTPIGQTNEEQKPSSDLFVGGFGAYHPAGVNFLFGDGQVRFVSTAIDQGVYEQLGHRADGKLLTSGPTREE